MRQILVLNVDQTEKYIPTIIQTMAKNTIIVKIVTKFIHYKTRIMEESTKDYLFSLLRTEFDDTFLTAVASKALETAKELLGEDDHRVIEMISDFEIDFN